VIEITNSLFSSTTPDGSPKPLKLIAILGVGDALNGWLKAARHCKSLTRREWRFFACPRISTSTLNPTILDVSNRFRSMSGFKEPGFSDRQKAAQQAKQKLLDKFRSQPTADDPEVAKRRAERAAVAASREKARLAREAEKAEQKRKEEEAAAAEAARLAREKEEETARAAELEAEQKAKRDARYAARKERGKKKR
jgi:hypothetical protein